MSSGKNTGGGQYPAGTKRFEIVQTDAAALPVGPYSQATKANGFIFVAGEKGIDPVSNKIVAGGIEAETRQTLENIKAILAAAGSDMESIVNTFVYLTDLKDFAKMNAVYSEYFQSNPPSRTTVEVKSLPVGAIVEITVTALDR